MKALLALSTAFTLSAAFGGETCPIALDLDIRPYLTAEDRQVIADLSASGEFAEALKAYLNGRVRGLQLTATERAYIEGIPVVPDANLMPTHIKIFMPSKWITTILKQFMLSHEMEHRIHLVLLKRMGLVDPFATSIFASDLYRLEADAMRAEWEFANALSPYARQNLCEILQKTVGKLDVKARPLLAVCKNLSLIEYIAYNHKHRRYHGEECDYEIAMQTPHFAQSIAKEYRGRYNELTGEWRVPTGAIAKPYSRYTKLLNRVLKPSGVTATITEQADAPFVILSTTLVPKPQ